MREQGGEWRESGVDTVVGGQGREMDFVVAGVALLLRNSRLGAAGATRSQGGRRIEPPEKFNILRRKAELRTRLSSARASGALKQAREGLLVSGRLGVGFVDDDGSIVRLIRARGAAAVGDGLLEQEGEAFCDTGVLGANVRHFADVRAEIVELQVGQALFLCVGIAGFSPAA